MSIMATAATVRKDQILSGAALTIGVRYVVEGNRWEQVVWVGTGDKDAEDGSDPSRARALFLVLELKAHSHLTEVTCVRLDADFDYRYDSERVRFNLGDNLGHGIGLASIEVVGVARTEDSLKEGDVIQSGRVGEIGILKQQRDDQPPGVTAEFVVVSVSKKGGGPCPGPNSPHDVFPDGRYVTAVRVTGSYDSTSDRVEFYISGSFARDVKINCVRLIGTVSYSRTLIEVAPLSLV